MSTPTGTLVARINQAFEQNQFTQAQQLLEEHVAQSPSAPAFNMLAVCCQKLGEIEAALHNVRKALQLDPNNSQYINNLAIFSSEAGALEVTDESADHSLTPESWNQIGLNFYFQGEFDQARHGLMRAIELRPDYFTAYYNLSDLLHESEYQEWLAKIMQLNPATNSDKAAVEYFKAHIFDKQNNHQGALEAWHSAAKHRSLVFDQPFNPQSHTSLVDGIIKLFNHDFIRQLQDKLQDQEQDQRDYIFIVGMPRSGSTLTSRMLCGDARVVDLGERNTFASATLAELDRLGDGTRAPFNAIDQQSIAAIRQKYQHGLANKAIYLDKYLENFMFLGLIHAAFPNAKIIHTQRDRFDTLFSCYTKNFTQGNKWTYNTSHLSTYYQSSERLMAHWLKVFPQNVILQSQYESLTQDPKAALLELCAHCNLNADQALERGHTTKGKVLTASAQQVRGKIKARESSPYAAYQDLITF